MPPRCPLDDTEHSTETQANMGKASGLPPAGVTKYLQHGKAVLVILAQLEESRLAWPTLAKKREFAELIEGLWLG